MSSASAKFLEYTQDSTLHGVNHVIDKKRNGLQRTLWILLFLAACGTLIRLIYTSFTTYYAYPVSSKMEYITERHVAFPTVTICNNNRVRKSYVESHDNPALQLSVDMMASDAETLHDFSDPATIADLQSVDMDQVGSDGAHRKEDMFLECFFPGVNASQSPCQFHYDDLFISTKTTLGYCFSFHPARYIEKHGVLVSKREGTVGGLQMLVDIQQDEYQVAGRAAGIKQGKYCDGSTWFQLLVHDPLTEPSVEQKGVSVSPGAYTRMAVTKSVFENLPHPYGTCKDTNPHKDPAFVNPLQFFRHYSYDACKEECMMQFMIRQCGCVAYYMNAPNVTVCNIFVYLTCSRPTVGKYYADESIEEACGCFRPCEETKYTVSLSTASLPSEYILPSLQTRYGRSKEYFKQNWIELKIFFEELGHTKITQSPDFTMPSLLAECGGLMGLFIGASVLTLAEFLEAVISTLAVWCSSRKNMVKTVHVESSTG